MQGGFALLEAGSVRMNNSTNILLKNIYDFAFGTLGFFVSGWGLSFGESIGGGLMGTTGFFPDEGLDYAGFVFQLSFAATAATIDSGACAERMHFNVYLGLSFIVTAWIYLVVVHWVWSNDGWLLKMGLI